MDDNSMDTMESNKRNVHVSLEINDADVAKDNIFSGYCESVRSCKTNSQKTIDFDKQ